MTNKNMNCDLFTIRSCSCLVHLYVTKVTHRLALVEPNLENETGRRLVIEQPLVEQEYSHQRMTSRQRTGGLGWAVGQMIANRT